MVEKARRLREFLSLISIIMLTKLLFPIAVYGALWKMVGLTETSKTASQYGSTSDDTSKKAQ